MAATHASKRSSWLARLPGQHKMLVAIVPLLCLFLLDSVFTLNVLYEQENARHWAEHTYKVMLVADQAQQAHQASVLASRGYVLTQEPAELASLADADSRLNRAIGSMRALTADNPTQQVRIDRLQTQVARWQDEGNRHLLAPLRQLRQADPANSVAQRAQIRDSYLGHRSIEPGDIAASLRQITQAEEVLLAQRTGTLDQLMRILRIVNVLAALAGLLFGLYAIRIANRLVVLPLQQITALMKRVGAGDTSVVVTRLQRPDEIGDLARALQVFKDIVAETRDNSWLKTQLSTVSRHLQEAASHREFGQCLTSQLAPLLGAGAALYYIHDPHSQRLDLLGSYGFRQSWDPVTVYVPGEGLVGQCVIERAPIELEHLPEHYLRIHSGSGEALPGAVAIFPVLYREQVIGVLELASFHALAPRQRAFLGELMPLIALTQENLTRAINTQDLLARTKEQADDLRTSELLMRQQKDVLRQSNDALHAKTRNWRNNRSG